MTHYMSVYYNCTDKNSFWIVVSTELLQISLGNTSVEAWSWYLNGGLWLPFSLGPPSTVTGICIHRSAKHSAQHLQLGWSLG
jgi:hypothetical protein